MQAASALLKIMNQPSCRGCPRFVLFQQGAFALNSQCGVLRRQIIPGETPAEMQIVVSRGQIPPALKAFRDDLVIGCRTAVLNLRGKKRGCPPQQGLDVDVQMFCGQSVIPDSAGDGSECGSDFSLLSTLKKKRSIWVFSRICSHLSVLIPSISPDFSQFNP